MFNNKEVLIKLSKLNYEENFKNIFDILIKYENRIVFVKETIGLKNVLFISELGTEEFAHCPFYLSLNLEIEDDNEFNFLSLRTSMVEDLEKIEEDLENFFIDSKEKLYFWFCGKESCLNEDDLFYIFEECKKDNTLDLFEFKAEIRKYPSWLQAKMPSEIRKEEEILMKLKILDQRLHEEEKNKILQEIDQAIANKNKKDFLEASERFKKITNFNIYQ